MNTDKQVLHWGWPAVLWCGFFLMLLAGNACCIIVLIFAVIFSSARIHQGNEANPGQYAEFIDGPVFSTDDEHSSTTSTFLVNSSPTFISDDDDGFLNSSTSTFSDDLFNSPLYEWMPANIFHDTMDDSMSNDFHDSFS